MFLFDGFQNGQNVYRIGGCSNFCFRHYCSFELLAGKLISGVTENKSKVLVTGGAGFVGSHLVKMLVDEGREVRVLEKPGALTDHLPSDRIEVVHVDLRDPLGVESAAAGCQVVLHLAANPNLWARDSEEFEQVSVKHKHQLI